MDINELYRRESDEMAKLLHDYESLEAREGFARIVKCPVCGHRAVSGSIGEVYCGPHGGQPARVMVTVRQTI